MKLKKFQKKKVLLLNALANKDSNNASNLRQEIIKDILKRKSKGKKVNLMNFH